ncbi:flagellar export chaperone FliS [Massilia sp. TSP1-1-2]|uniref:flagellar export chaperone FliS n=1 Tax=Massilia sp. TSP1-1-2 TaxID=2804649 RepID=UPI003CFB42AC
MFGSTRSGANAYAKVGLETGVVAASPHKLIVMLFEGAIVAINNARTAMKAGQFEVKGKAITKAVLIVDEGMRASLDKKAGGEIATNLDALYAYIIQCLMRANLRNDQALLDEALTLLTDLKTAWDAIGNVAPPAPAPAPAPRATVYDGLAPRATSYVSA